MNAPLGRLATTGACLVLGLLGTELAVRRLVPPPPQLRDATGELLLQPPGALERYAAELNEAGFHDHPWTKAKGPGERQVFVLGDSSTAGRQLAREELFTEIVERRLNARALPGERYEVLNVAQVGWATTAQLRVLEAMLADGWEPDAVLVAYFINDATGSPVNPGLAAATVELLEHRAGLLNRVSRAWDWLDLCLRARRVSALTLRHYRESLAGDARAQAFWRASQVALRRMRSLAERHGFRLGVVVLPVLMQLDEGHDLRELYDIVEDRVRAMDIPVRQLLPAYYGERPEDLWVLPTNPHPNARAHAIAARAVEAFLVEEGLVFAGCAE